jgi:hypothetical protein
MDIHSFFAWEQATRDTIDVKKIYIDLVDDLIAGILLSQIVFWFLPTDDGKSKLRVEKDGEYWLAKGREDWWDECRIKPRQSDEALKKLVELGIIEKRLYKFNGTPTTHLRIVWETFLKLLNEKLQTMQDDLLENEPKTLATTGINEFVKSDLHKNEFVNDDVSKNVVQLIPFHSENGDKLQSEWDQSAHFQSIPNIHISKNSAQPLDTIGFNKSVKSISHNRESHLSKSVNSLTEITTETTMKNIECMNGEAAGAAPDSTHTITTITCANNGDRGDNFAQKLMDTIYEGCQNISVAPDKDATGYFDEFYLMLTKCFKGMLDIEVLKLAFRIYEDKRVDLYRRKVMYPDNPTGWLHDAYKDAIKQYKAIRYVEDRKEKEKILKEMSSPAHYYFSNRGKSVIDDFYNT